MSNKTGTEVKKRNRNRAYCFTINNPNLVEEHILKEWDSKKAPMPIYMIVGEEVGEKGTPHYQGYIHFKNAIEFNTLKKILVRAHIEVAKGSPEQNRTYCTKEGKILVEMGELPKGQGCRTDLNKIKDNIVNGDKVDNIIMETPMVYHQYGRTLNKIEDLCMRKKYRTEMTKGIWYFGSTGVGKSHLAFDGFTPETHYVYPNDNGWWDGYTQQDTVIFNDFRGEITYNFLLQLVDKWPLTVKRRCREPMPFTSKLVIITSSLAPEDLFNRRNEEDDIAQLMRRFEVFEVTASVGTEVVGGNTKPPPTKKKHTPIETFDQYLNI